MLSWLNRKTKNESTTSNDEKPQTKKVEASEEKSPYQEKQAELIAQWTIQNISMS